MSARGRGPVAVVLGRGHPHHLGPVRPRGGGRRGGRHRRRSAISSRVTPCLQDHGEWLRGRPRTTAVRVLGPLAGTLH